MGSLYRQFSPLLVSFLFGLVLSIVIAVAAVGVTWTNAESEQGGFDSEGVPSRVLPSWFPERSPQGEGPEVARWVDGPLFHAAMVMQFDRSSGASSTGIELPNRITDSFIKAGFPWPWLERHDRSIARTIFAAENPWLKAELSPEYMGFDERFEPGIRIDVRALAADVLFYTAFMLGMIALVSSLFHGGSICRMPSWLVASFSLGVVLPVLMAWTSGLLLVGPSTTHDGLVGSGVMHVDVVSGTSAGDSSRIQDVIRVPGGSNVMTWEGDAGAGGLPLVSSELRLGWPVTMARTGDSTLPVLADTWEEVLLGFEDEGYLDLDHASLWKVIRAPVVWWGWLIDATFWTMALVLVIAPCIALRRWSRRRSDRCVSCRHRLAGSLICQECGREVASRRLPGLPGSLLPDRKPSLNH